KNEVSAVPVPETVVTMAQALEGFAIMPPVFLIYTLGGLKIFLFAEIWPVDTANCKFILCCQLVKSDKVEISRKTTTTFFCDSKRKKSHQNTE
ncbi:MAG: hypothetical protein ACK5HY_11725, partial [Parahaliea sp.]